MRILTLLPYLTLYKRHKLMLILGIILTISTLLANIGLLILSSWFLSASALVGIAGFHSFNYMLPAVGIRIISIIRIIGRYFERLINHDITFRVLQYLRVVIFSHLISLSPTKLVYFHHGELLNIIVADVNTLDHLYLRIILPLAGIFSIIVVITVGLSILNIMFALTLSCIMFFVLLFLLPFFCYVGKAIGKSLTNLRSEYRQQLITWIQGQTELTIFGANKRHRARMNSIELNWYKVQRRQSDLIALSQAIIILISGITVIIMFWMTSSYEGMSDNPRSGALIALFIFFALAISEMLTPVISTFQYLGKIINSAIRITKLIEQPSKIKFSNEHVQVPTCVTLHLHNVTFSYKEQLQPALNNFTLNIHSGEHIAILGRTGCGKSTLLQILTRAMDPCHGLIYINRVPIIKFSESVLRSTMSVVSQRVYLFIGTLRDNLLLASPSADDKQLSTVLEKVCLQKLLEGEGLNSWFGEGGRQLSDGELRRLAIARALLHNAPLMLLDEPTEGLDTTVKNRILNLLKQVTKDKTVLMVTHCLQDIEDFDRIIVMDNGQIIEQGNHTELLKKQGYYCQLRKHL